MSSGTFIIVLKLSRCVGGCYGALKNLTNKPTLQMTFVYLRAVRNTIIVDLYHMPVYFWCGWVDSLVVMENMNHEEFKMD